MDQSTATLLATLLGGLLSIVGGFIANYYIQSSSERTQKKKEIRNLLEQIYRLTQDLAANFDRLRYGVPFEDAQKALFEVQDSVNQIERRVNLYLPPLENGFAEYKKEILEALEYMDSSTHSGILKDDFDRKGTIVLYNTPAVEVANNKFRAALVRMLKEKGYSYF